MLEKTTLYLLCVTEKPYGLLNDVLYTSYAEAMRGLQYWQPMVAEPLGIAEFRFAGCSCPTVETPGGRHSPTK